MMFKPPMHYSARDSGGGGTPLAGKGPLQADGSVKGIYAVLDRVLNAASLGLGSALDAFRLPRKKRTALILEFIAEAQKAGHADSEIREMVQAYKYAARLGIWQDTSKDQAPSAIVCANTSAVNWFDLLEGGRPLIQDLGHSERMEDDGKKRGKALVNGIFGHREIVENSEDAKRIDDLTHVLYIIKHSLEHNNPLPAYIIIGGRSRDKTTIDKAVEHVRARFGKLVSDSLGTPDMIDGDAMQFKNPKTGQLCRIRIIGMIQDKEEGKMHVLELGQESAKPVDALKWLSEPRNVAYLLGIGISELSRLEKELEPAHEGRGWRQIAEEEPAHAQLIWSYWIIKRQRENLRRVAADPKETELDRFMNASRKRSCVDSRQSGQLKSLGAHSTQEEIAAVLRKEEVQKLQVAVHLKCGYLGTVIGLHNVSKEMAVAFAGKGKDMHEARKFFASNMKRLFTGDYRGPLAEPELFEHHMSALGIDRESATYSTLHAVFVKNDQLTRNALRHAYENGVMVWNLRKTTSSVPLMKAASRVDVMLNKFNCEGEVGGQLYNVLVTEEVARELAASGRHVLKSDAAFEGKEVEVVVEEFRSGRIYEVPQRPESMEQLLDAERNDALLGKLALGDAELLAQSGIGGKFDVLPLVA